jgi:peptidoglycan/xylan/chitin deacetylase (PgdA/CDA1 family)
MNRRYGAIEGIPRLLDLFDRVGVRVSSFMIGQSVLTYPDLAREIVARGHEAGGRAIRHAPQFHLPREEERAFLAAGFDALRRTTGIAPKGFNAQGLQGSPNTNSLLQELGLIYSIDDRTRDEPWIQLVNDGREFCLTPYMGHVNDLQFFQNATRSLADYEQFLKQEFEVLYEEGARRRRMMSVPLHDFVAGRPASAGRRGIPGYGSRAGTRSPNGRSVPAGRPRPWTAPYCPTDLPPPRYPSPRRT